MANDIYKVNSGDVIGGPGRLVWAPEGTAAPQAISEVMDTASPYDLVGPWQDLGATNEGITVTRGFETEDIPVDQSVAPIDSYISGWTHSIATQLAENTIENRQMALIGSSIVETPPETGTSTTFSSEVSAGATILNVTSATDFVEGGYLQLTEGVKKIVSISGTTITIQEPVTQSYTTTDNVTPILELGSKRIGYGAVEERPNIMLGLLNQKKDGTLYLAVFRKCKVGAEENEQVFQKGTRYLPLNLAAFPDDSAATDENVYYEIEQVI